MAQQRIRELEHHIEIREKELCDVKEAYAEKVRKCDGWEKVAPEVSMNLFFHRHTILSEEHLNNKMRI